jgi:hypothetical protein
MTIDLVLSVKDKVLVQVCNPSTPEVEAGES